jgi:hypothetical protein
MLALLRSGAPHTVVTIPARIGPPVVFMEAINFVLKGPKMWEMIEQFQKRYKCLGHKVTKSDRNYAASSTRSKVVVKL